jgi:hypothetical protein
MEEPRVSVYFYGSFINRAVLAKAGYRPRQWEVARLDRHNIVLNPLATLVRSDEHAVYGVLASATHGELARLYGQDWVREYLPEAVVVSTSDSRLCAALCYIARGRTAPAPFENYLEKILEPARALGFPQWYIRRLEALQVSSG